jgi:hypothetical protein
MVFRKLLRIEDERLHTADILFVFGRKRDEFYGGYRSTHNSLRALARAGKDDIGDQIVTAAGSAAAVEVFHADGLAVRKEFASQQEFTFLGGELFNDLLEFGFGGVGFGGGCGRGQSNGEGEEDGKNGAHDNS